MQSRLDEGIEIMSDQDDDRFDWSHNNGAVILPEQRSIAVYTNPFGQAVIRVAKNWPDEQDDPFLVIAHANIYQVIGALKAIADAPLQRDPPGTEQPNPANDQ